MTEKENYMKLLRGEQPEWVPKFTFTTVGAKHAPTAMVAPDITSYHRKEPGISIDVWGVTHVPVEEAGGGKIPEPDNFILKDIRQWRDVIKAPDISGVDFEGDAKRDLEKIDRNETAVTYDLSGGFFQLLISFMGFTEGLCAMFEEPEEVKALMEYLSDFTAKLNEKCIHYYKPDVASLVDDTATWQNPFFSIEMYRELIKPYHARQAKIATDLGLGIDMHNCGRCEDFIDDWREFGVVSWNPAQTSNDLVAIKKKYGNSLILAGCWDSRGRIAAPDVTEETVKQAVYKTIDTFAPGGGYMFQGGFLGKPGDPETAKKNKWIEEAVETYGRTFYRRADLVRISRTDS